MLVSPYRARRGGALVVSFPEEMPANLKDAVQVA